MKSEIVDIHAIEFIEQRARRVRGECQQKENPMKSFLRLFCILTLLCGSAVAQNYKIETLGASPAACSYAVTPLLAELKTMDYPDGWTFVVVCTDGEWDSLTRKIERLKLTDTAGTLPDKHVTILRGQIFAHQIGHGYRFTLLHELGHVLLNTLDEGKADGYAHEHMVIGKDNL